MHYFLLSNSTYRKKRKRVFNFQNHAPFIHQHLPPCFKSILQLFSQACISKNYEKCQTTLIKPTILRPPQSNCTPHNFQPNQLATYNTKKTPRSTKPKTTPSSNPSLIVFYIWQLDMPIIRSSSKWGSSHFLSSHICDSSLLDLIESPQLSLVMLLASTFVNPFGDTNIRSNINILKLNDFERKIIYHQTWQFMIIYIVRFYPC